MHDPIPAPPKFELPVPPPPIPEPPPRPELALPPVAFEPPLPALPDKLDPLVYALRGDSGDSPMLRNWKMLAFCSLMASAAPVLPPTPVFAQGVDESKVLERLDKLEKSITASIKALSDDVSGVRIELGKLKIDVADSKVDIDFVKKAVDSLKTEKLNLRIDLEKQIASIRGDLEGLRNQIRNLPSGANPPIPAPPVTDKSGLDDIKAKLGSIEQAILKLQPSQNRIALAPPSPAAASTGRVLLINLHSEELLFVVNQKTHRVAPGASVPLDAVPSGSLSYEVLSPTWGLRARNTTSLAANETFTLTAR